jgi:hypothetical protein
MAEARDPKEVEVRLEPPAPRMALGLGVDPLQDMLIVRTRQLAISVLLADEAGREPEVVVLRRRHVRSALPNRPLSGLLREEEVDGWILARAPKDSQSGAPVRPLAARKLGVVGEGADADCVWALPESTASGTPGEAARYLWYALPESPGPRALPTEPGGVLDELRLVSEMLARRYGWHVSQAVLFVLTGQIPLVPPIKTELRLIRPLTSGSRVILSIDPDTAPEELAAHFRRARRALRGGAYRPLSEKHAFLAFFVARRPRRERWARRMDAWNAAYPQWRYERVTNFSRDALQSQRRLVRPHLAYLQPEATAPKKPARGGGER